jgi:putative oxidoreductase
MFKRLLSARPYSIDVALLILRLGAGGFMIVHGWSKLMNFNKRLSTFSDPIGLGSEASLSLIVFAEFFCALFVIIGFYTRLALVPLIIAMCVVAFIVHGADPFGTKEKALLFLVAYLSLFFTGPGKFSVDSRLRKS